MNIEKKVKILKDYIDRMEIHKQELNFINNKLEECVRGSNLTFKNLLNEVNIDFDRITQNCNELKKYSDFIMCEYGKFVCSSLNFKRKKIKKKPALTKEKIEEAIKLRNDFKFTMKQLAERYKVSIPTLRKYMENQNIIAEKLKKEKESEINLKAQCEELKKTINVIEESIKVKNESSQKNKTNETNETNETDETNAKLNKMNLGI